MLKIHQPLTSSKRIIFSILFVTGALLLASHPSRITIENNPQAYAAGDYRTIHDIEYMQDMSQQICSNTTVQDVATLKDKRDNNTYNVVKLVDGNCWMQQNLKLAPETNLADPEGKNELTPDDTNIEKRWLLADNDEASGSFLLVKTVVGSTELLGNDYRPEYGNYYSYCAAAALTNKVCYQDSEGEGGDNVATGDVCPKNWHLPVLQGDTSFDNLIKIANIGNNGELLTQTPYNMPYAGYVTTKDTLKLDGGRYYINVSSGLPFMLYFTQSKVDASRVGASITNASQLPIRCVSAGNLPKIEPPAVDEQNGQIQVVVQPTLTLDAVSGMTKTADPNHIITGEINATVTSNADYDVFLSAQEPNLIGKTNSANQIPTTSADNPVKVGNNAWGILNASGLYDPITTDKHIFHNTSTTNGNTTTHIFSVGVSISPVLPADTYSTEVTVTAATK